MQRHLLHIIVLLLVVLTGCQQTVRKELLRAEQLLDENPDSAFLILDGLHYESESYSKSQRMYFHLLYAQSQNKTDRSLSGQDSVLREVVDYYGWWGNNNERMKANYMLGSAYRDEGNAPLALKYYRNALEEVDTTASYCDFCTVSRIYGQIATVFNMQRAPRLELEAERKAVEYAWKAKDTISAIIFNVYISGAYHMMNQMDSALYYTQNAASQFNSIGRKDLAAGTLGIDIDIYLRQKDYDKAKRALDEYDANSGSFDEKGNIRKGAESFYYSKGQYYEGVNRLDSAEYYYRRLLQSQPDKNSEEAAYKGLLSIYGQLGIADSIAKYADLYCQVNDSASFAHSADEITRMHSLYNYNESERRAILNEQKADKYKTIIIVIVMMIVICCYLIYRFIRKQRQQQRAELIKANSAYSSLLTQYSRAQEDLKATQNDLDGYRISKEEEILHLQQQLLSYQDNNAKEVNIWDAEQAMLHSTIVTHLHKIASRATKASEVEWKDLNCFVIDKMPDFIDYICDESKKLTEKELRVCMLTRLHFIPTEIVALLNLSKQRITNIRACANRKLFNEEGSRSFDANIHKL